MVDRLCVPLIQRLLARNWNWAISGFALTASRVANSAAVSTPLCIGVSVVVMLRNLFLWERTRCALGWRNADHRGPAVVRRTSVVTTDSPRNRHGGTTH